MSRLALRLINDFVYDVQGGKYFYDSIPQKYLEARITRDLLFPQLSWYRCECISRESFKVWHNTSFYNVKHESLISYWEGEIGKGQRTESWGPQQSWISTVNMLAGNWENLKAVLGFIISVHIIKPQSKQRLLPM